MPSRLTPARIALLYAAFAAAWIVASGYLLTLTVTDPVLQGRIEMAKGLLFVAVTAGLLYLLLKVWRDSSEDRVGSAAAAISPPPKASRLFALFVAATLAVLLAGLGVVNLYGPQTERDAYANLQAIADLKAHQIEHWLDERDGDAMMLASDRSFSSQLAAIVRQPHAADLSRAVLERFASLRKGYAYTSILLFDTRGKILLIQGTEADDTPTLQQNLRQAMDSRKVQRGDLYRDETGNVHLDWVVPIHDPAATPLRAAGAVVLRITAQQFIFPLIQTRPSASASAETLLVRSEGDAVLYLNELRHRTDAALTLALPFSATLPAAVAIRAARPGALRGRDYRGVDVLAAYRPVAETRWHVVAKIDREEVLAPLRHMAFLVSVVAFFALAAIGAVVLLLWRQQQRTYKLALQATAMAAIEESELKYRTLADSGQALIWTADTDKLCNYFNAAWLAFTGRTLEQERGNGWAEGVHPDDFQRCLDVYVSAFDRREKFSIEYRLRRHDGEYRWIQDDGCPRYDAAGEFIGYIGYCLDITARKADQAKIQRLTRFYAVLTQCNQAIVRSADETELFPLICRAAVQYGGMSMAWIGLRDEAGKQVNVVAAFGDAHDSLAGIHIPMDADAADGRGPIATAIRDNRPCWCQDLQHDPDSLPWHELGTHCGWGAAAVLPLCRDGSVIGVLTLYAGEANAFDEDVRRLLEEMATDIDFALDNFSREARRERAEDNAQLLTQRLSLATDAAAIGIWDWDLRTDQWYATPTYFTMLGYAPDEGFADRKLWIERIHPDERDAVAEKIQAALAGSGAPYQYEARMRHADGSWHWISIVGRVAERDEKGKATRMLGMRMDITEGKQTALALAEKEIRLRTLVETLPDLVWLKDKDGVYLGCNPMFERFFGAKEANIVGKTDYDFVDKTLADSFRVNDINAMAADKPTVNEEWIVFADDGHRALLETIKTPMRDAAGRLVGVLGVARDITARKQAETDLAEQLEELRRWHANTMGREARILELKHEVNEMLSRNGQPPRYPSAESPDSPEA